MLKNTLFHNVKNEMGSSRSYSTSFNEISWKSVLLFLCNLVYKKTSPEMDKGEKIIFLVDQTRQG